MVVVVLSHQLISPPGVKYKLLASRLNPGSEKADFQPASTASNFIPTTFSHHHNTRSLLQTIAV